ncbi:DUF927 domain-containing protein, partial [Phenylobacterium sp.]|uniref:DUF927 domain-containing protein n=1 Tax=Phenylobacterium sp. TaxID=1871053 RepID=UPI0025DD2F6A
LMGLGKQVPVEELQAALGKYVQAPALPQLAPRLTPAGNSNDELGAGIAVGTRLVDIEQVRKTCAFVDNALTTGGAALHNPLWLMTTSIASFCEDGRTQAHRMADQHRTYTVEETDRLYDRVLATRTRRDFGWPKCSRIDALGAKECQTCPLRPLDKSPLNHPPAPAGQGSAPAGAGAAPASDMPAGYTRDQLGRVCKIVLDDNGASQTLPICAYPMTDAWLQDNPWVLHFSTIIHSGRAQKIEAPLAEMSAREGIGKIMGRQGIVLPEKGAQVLREFFVAWIQRLQQSKNSVVSSTPFGWTVANGKLEGFTYAGRVWGDGEDRPAASPDPILSYQYSPKGELGPWLEAARIITDQKRPHLDAILAASFGGPLVRFTGQAGVMLSCYSPESGIGKSTAMRVAQAIWGDPQKALQSLNDTANSVIRKIGEIKNLPLLWDEIKTESETSKFVLMSFQLTQGKERSRLNADVTQRDPGTWQTLLISASNDSLIDPIQRVTKSTNAGLYRLFEYQVPPGVHGQVEHSMVSRTIAKLNDHYGQAGLAYARFLGANSDRIAREVAEIQDELSREVSAGNDERFWIATMTVVLAGARYANELGLTEIDEAALKNLMVIVLGNMRSEIKDAPTDMKNQLSVSTILAQFLNAMRARHTLRTSKIHVGRGKPPKNSVQIRSDVTKLDAIYVQIGEDDGLMRISSTHFSQWMSDRDYSRHAFVKALEQEFGVKTTHGRLGSGTQFANTTEYLLELDLNDPRLKGFVE